jgi:hypothetical protein
MRRHQGQQWLVASDEWREKNEKRLNTEDTEEEAQRTQRRVEEFKIRTLRTVGRGTRPTFSKLKPERVGALVFQHCDKS